MRHTSRPPRCIVFSLRGVHYPLLYGLECERFIEDAPGWRVFLGHEIIGKETRAQKHVPLSLQLMRSRHFHVPRMDTEILRGRGCYATWG